MLITSDEERLTLPQPDGFVLPARERLQERGVTFDRRLHAYIMVALLTGAGRGAAGAGVGACPPRPGHRTAVLGSVAIDASSWRHQNTKVAPHPGLGQSRCRLRVQRVQWAKERLAPGEQWTETGLVFTTRLGIGIHAANVRRDLAWCPGSGESEASCQCASMQFHTAWA